MPLRRWQRPLHQELDQPRRLAGHRHRRGRRGRQLGLLLRKGDTDAKDEGPHLAMSAAFWAARGEGTRALVPPGRPGASPPRCGSRSATRRTSGRPSASRRSPIRGSGPTANPWRSSGSRTAWRPDCRSRRPAVSARSPIAESSTTWGTRSSSSWPPMPSPRPSDRLGARGLGLGGDQVRLLLISRGDAHPPVVQAIWKGKPAADLVVQVFRAGDVRLRFAPTHAVRCFARTCRWAPYRCWRC